MPRRTIFHLVRHAAHERLGSVLAGRLNGVHLTLPGRAQAQDLAQHFAREDIAAVITSPRERAQETADPIARKLGQEMRVSNALDEINMGGWQGRSFADLAKDADWCRWNAHRSMARPPRGETMADVQTRILGELLHLHATACGAQFVLVSHMEPIRALLLHVLGLTADSWSRIEIDAASISTVAIDDDGGRILRMNMPALMMVAA